MREQQLSVGTIVGHYRLVHLLGQGGFAEVYLGEHLHLKTSAAIKVLHTRLTGQDVQEFQREAQMVAQLLHPHIVRVLDFGTEQGAPYLVMDYAPNGTVRQLTAQGTPLPLPQIVSFTSQIADALYYAHQQRLIHRDVKPENMLLGRNREVLLSDFGIALVLQSSHLQSTQTIAGTIAYMAPEQIQAHPGPASDQYALAVVVYEWLCGRRPFQGSYTEVAIKHSVAPPPPLRQQNPQLSEELERVVLTALQKEPQQRFPTVKAFAQALEQAAARTGTAMYSATMIKPQVPPLALPVNNTPWNNQPPAPTVSQPLLTPPPAQGSGYQGYHYPQSGPVMQTPPLQRFPQAPQQRPAERGTSRRAFLVGGLAGAAGVLGVGGFVAWSYFSRSSGSGQGVRLPGIPGLPKNSLGAGQGDVILSYTKHTKLIWKIVWSADGALIASGSMDGTAQVWTADQAETRLSVRSKVEPPQSDDYPWSLAWSSSKRQWLAVGFVDGTIQVLDLKGGQKLAGLQKNDANPVALVAWSPDERYLAVGSGDAVRVYRYPEWEVVRTYEEHTNFVKDVAWSPDGAFLASGSSDTQVRVWEPLTGRTRLIYKGHSDAIRAISWSPDSKHLVSSAGDQFAKVWSVDGTTSFTYKAPGGAPIGEVHWSHNGKLISVYNGEAKIDILDAGSGEIKQTLASGVAFSHAWSPDDTKIVGGIYEMKAQVFQL